jgi:hypothetical protein
LYSGSTSPAIGLAIFAELAPEPLVLFSLLFSAVSLLLQIGFPVIGQREKASKIAKRPINTGRLDARAVPQGQFFRFSLYFSLLWAKNGPETG